MATELEMLRSTVEIIHAYAQKRHPTRDERIALAQLGGVLAQWADSIDDTRMEPPANAEGIDPELGRVWRPQPGVTFLAASAYVRTFIEIEPGPVRGMVGMDIAGKWNHGAKDTLSAICHRDTAEEWGRFLIEAAHQAPLDEAAFKEAQRGREP